MKISAVIITYNEEDRLQDTLSNISGWVDEIVVVDSFSTDNTLKIAASFGAVIFKHPFADYGSQKNFAMSKASSPWILNLDADERISPELKDAIMELKKKKNITASGFLIKRKAFYLGKWINHSGWYPDRKIRLFRRGSARWEGRIHERLIVSGQLEPLEGDILHYTYRDIGDHMARINRYSDFQAQDLAKGRKKLLLPRAIILPIFTFIRHYFWRIGVLDGIPGLVIALISSWGTCLKYLKARELRRKKTDHSSGI